MDNMDTSNNQEQKKIKFLNKKVRSTSLLQSGSSFPWFRCAEKPSIYAPFGTWYFSGNRFLQHLFSKTCFRADEIVPLGLQLNLKIA